MILVLLVATLVSCDPVLTALFTPARPSVGRYQICTTAQALDLVAQSAEGPHYSPSEMLDPLDAFGSVGSYNRAALARLYIGKQVRVVRGWTEHADRFESVTLLSPYPDATLTRLVPGTMMIRWSVSK
jgi:hypothetical protein